MENRKLSYTVDKNVNLASDQSLKPQSFPLPHAGSGSFKNKDDPLTCQSD